MIKKKKNRILILYAVYTLFFLILFYSCYLYWFNKYGKSFIWSLDDLNQGYNSFLYMGRFIRTIFSNVVSNTHPIVPIWDTTIGMGADVHVTLGTNFFDIFQWVSAFVQPEHAEKAFNICIIIKLYLVGFTYILYSYYRFNSYVSSLAGGIVYTFSASLYMSFIHFDFVNPFYIFPLVMMGADMLWNNKKRGVFIFSIFFAFLNHFYFAYMMSIMVALYVIIRYVVEGDRDIKVFFKCLMRYLVNALIGIGLATFAYLPIILNVSQTDRLDIDYGVGFYFAKNYYRSTVYGFASLFDTGRDAYLGFAAIVLPILGLLFLSLDRKLWSDKELIVDKIFFILLSVVWCVPKLCSVMNGFSYANQRWVFGYVFIVALLVSHSVKYIYNLNKARAVGMMLGSIIPVISAYTVFLKDGNSKRKVMLGAIIALSISVILCIYQLLKYKGIFERIFSRFRVVSNWKIYAVLFIVLVGVSAFLNAYMTFNGDRFSDTAYILQQEIDRGTAYKQVYDTGGSELIRDLDGVGMRVDGGEYRIRNCSWATGHSLSTFDFYEPYYNNDVNRFFGELGVRSSSNCVIYDNVDGRAILDELLGAGYYLKTSWRGNDYPVIYGDVINENESYILYKSDGTDIVHFFDKAVTASLVDGLNSYEKERVISKAVILEDDESDVQNIAVNADLDNLAIVNTDDLSTSYVLNDVSISGNEYVVANDGGNLDYTDLDIHNSSINVCIENIRMKENLYDYYGVVIDCLKDGALVATDYIGNRTPITHMYGNKHDWCSCISYVDDIDEIQIRFEKHGTYLLDGLNIYIDSKEDILTNVSEIKRPSHIINSYGTVTSVDVNSSADGYVFLAIPYSTGWTAKVNGETVNILKADYGFMAVPVSEGASSIVLRYYTPGLSLGLIISFFSLCFLCMSFIIEAKRVKKI